MPIPSGAGGNDGGNSTTLAASFRRPARASSPGRVWLGGGPAPSSPASPPPVVSAAVLAPAARRGQAASRGAAGLILAPPGGASPGPGGGQLRFSPGECCGCGCAVTVCVVICGSMPVVGAEVLILTTAGVTVGQCWTGTSGCCSITVPAAGNYQLEVWVSGAAVYSGVRSFSCNGTITIPLSSAGLVCCGGYAIPQNLTLTDAAGSIAFDYYSGYYYPIWYGGHAVTRTSCSVSTPGGICVSNPPSSGPVRICYQMICYAGQNPTFAIQRSWSWVYQQGTLTATWYQDPSGFTPGLPCVTAPPASCGSPLTDTASDNENPISSSPFVINFSPVPAGSNATSDPVGGTVTVSA